MWFRRAALPTLALSTLICVPAGAASTNAPTMTSATSIAGQALSRPLADGSWATKNGVWTATVHSVSPAGGTTVVRASWTSPVVLGKPHQVWFATSFSVTHEGESAGSSRYVERARICYPRRGCERWFSEQADAVPQQYDASTLPYSVGFGHGLSFKWGNRGYRAYVQWEYVQTQEGLDEQTNTIEAAVGSQAHTVQSS